MPGDFDRQASKRDAGAAKPVRVAAEEEPGDDKGAPESGEAISGAIPAARLVIEGDEGRDDGKPNPGQRDAGAGTPDPAEDLAQRDACAANHRLGRQAVGNQAGEQRRCCDDQRQRSKTAAVEHRNPQGRADRHCRVKRDPDRHQSLAGILRTAELNSPRHRAGQEQAVADPERHTAGNDRRQAGGGAELDQCPDKIENPGQRRDQGADHNRRPGAAPVRKPAGQGPRQQRRRRLGADHDADDDRVEAEPIVDKQRYDRQRRADCQIDEENREVERQQPDDKRQIGFGLHRGRKHRRKDAIRHSFPRKPMRGVDQQECCAADGVAAAARLRRNALINF